MLIRWLDLPIIVNIISPLNNYVSSHIRRGKFCSFFGFEDRTQASLLIPLHDSFPFPASASSFPAASPPPERSHCVEMDFSHFWWKQQVICISSHSAHFTKFHGTGSGNQQWEAEIITKLISLRILKVGSESRSCWTFCELILLCL